MSKIINTITRVLEVVGNNVQFVCQLVINFTVNSQ